MSVSKFYQFELERLKNEFEKISFFTKHPITLGSYRERILKDYLQTYTPKNLKIDSGFVFDFNNAEQDQLYKGQTKQVDCLIYDENNYTPFLKTNDFAIIEPVALYGSIEIKSSLTFYKEYDHNNNETTEKYPLKYTSDKPYRWTGTLVQALENIKSVAEISNKYGQYCFKGIFSYSNNVDYRNFLFAFDNGELQLQLGYKHLSELPDYICVPNTHLISFGRVSLFEAESMGFDSSQSHMTVIETVEENKGFALQFFTNAYKISVEHRLNKKNHI